MPKSTPAKRPSTTTGKPKTTGKPNRAEPNRGDKAKPQTGKPGLDRFGNRPGTIRAKLNAALSKRPQSMQQLMDAAKTEQTHYNHLNRLVAAGHVVKDGNGNYHLP